MSERRDTDELTNAVSEPKSRLSGLKDLASRLYRGDAGIDVVGKRKIWYLVALTVLLVAVLSFTFRGFALGIDFKGGNSFTVPASVGTLEETRVSVEKAGVEVASAQRIGGAGGSGASYVIKTEELGPQQANDVRQQIAEDLNIPVNQISQSAVSGAWGSQVTWKALQGALIFLVLVVGYLALVFREWRMAVAALAALVQNLVLTAGVYSLVGFEVTPSTVIGFLTILGFALYDVVVVFDKVRENTRGITGNPNRTYGEAANLAVNQTLMRSINTAVVALLPVGGLLFIGAGLLGAGTLKDLGLVLFVGMLAAVYSSIFLATPVLVDLKEREPKFKLHKQRVLARRAAGITGERKPVKVAPPRQDDKAAEAAPVGEAVAAATTPRVGARPQPRKRPGSKPGAKTGGRSGGGRSGGGRSGGGRSGGAKRR
jgi:preprotein translocase subunit SecF